MYVKKTRFRMIIVDKLDGTHTARRCKSIFVSNSGAAVRNRW